MGLLLITLVSPAAAQEPAPEEPHALPETVCQQPARPSPTEPGGWGPVWDEDSSGGLLPAVTIFSGGGADLWVETKVYLGRGQILGTSEGPFTASVDGTLPVALALPSEIGSRLARVTILVTATHPDTGSTLAHAAARAFAYRDASGAVSLLRDEEAEAIAVGVGAVQDGFANHGLIGREVSL